MPARLQVVIVGHVDHGKSTLMGRLLADSGALPAGKLEQLQAYCQTHARQFEYAFLLDALKRERAQGITLDLARIFFKSAGREYLLLDAPGHSAFLKNMVTGASRADAALMVLDISEGLQESSFRHGHLLSLLGVQQIGVLVNKMDKVGWAEAPFRKLVAAYAVFLASLGLQAQAYVPVSGLAGANLLHLSEHTPWYQGPSLIELLAQFQAPEAAVDLPLRLPVQDVYKFTRDPQAPRLIVGQLESGKLAAGAEIIVYPSGQRSRVRHLQAFPGPAPAQFQAGEAASLSLEDALYIRRGDVLALAHEAPPQLAQRLLVRLIWLGTEPLQTHKSYDLRLGTQKIPVQLLQVQRRTQIENLQTHSVASAESITEVQTHEIADCLLQLARPLVCESKPEHASLNRFVLVDQHRIQGGGLILDLPETLHPSATEIGPKARQQRAGHPAALVHVSGTPQQARQLEADLFGAGYQVYLLDAEAEARLLALQAAVLLDAGFLVLSQTDLMLPETLTWQLDLSHHSSAAALAAMQAWLAETQT